MRQEREVKTHINVSTICHATFLQSLNCSLSSPKLLRHSYHPSSLATTKDGPDQSWGRQTRRSRVKSCSRHIHMAVSRCVPKRAWKGKASAYHWQWLSALESIPTSNPFFQAWKHPSGEFHLSLKGEPQLLGALVFKWGDQSLVGAILLSVWRPASAPRPTIRCWCEIWSCVRITWCCLLLCRSLGRILNRWIRIL